VRRATWRVEANFVLHPLIYTYGFWRLTTKC
jgi:hypothetical protein